MSAGASDSPVFDFTSLDFSSANADLIRYAQITYPNELWTDFNDSNWGTGLIELLSYSTDKLAYVANAQALEVNPVTLIREQNFRNIAKGLDYKLKSASPSRATVRCTLDSLGTYPFTISKHLQFATTDGLIFQPDADTAVASYPGLGYVDVAATQGEEHYQEVLGTTNGTSNQKFRLKNAYLIDGTLSVQVGLTGYTEVTNFVSASPTDKVYILETDEDGNTDVIFGDGINGAIPPKAQTVQSTYKTGGGIETNLPGGTIKRVYGTADGAAVPPQITAVTNPARATGGASKQSLSNAKQNLPLSLKANERCVTLQDYAAAAVELVPGVLKANAISGRPQGGSTPILLFVVPNGGGNPTDSLRNLTIVKLKDKRLAGKRIRVFDPVYVNLLIEADAFIQQNAVANDTKNKVSSILQAKYDMEAVDFGSSFNLQDVYDDTSAATVPGIRHVFYKTFSVRPYYARHVNSPTTGNGIIDYIATNLDTVRRREWLVQVLPPSPPINCPRFQVLQRRLGTVTGVTDSLVTDESADYLVNELFSGGWSFRPRPEDNAVTFSISGNTTTTISTSSGLLTLVEPDDPYVVEKAEAGIGKILRTTLSSAVVASDTLLVASTDSWQVGDILHVEDNPSEYYTVIGITPGVSLQVDRNLTSAVNSKVDYVWQSGDASVKFSVIGGTTPFVVGDELYVDTYARAGDIRLRDENFPLLDTADLFVNPIGGVK